MVKIADHSTVIYGTHFPNRIFVGCLPAKATAQDLAEFFSYFGAVNEAKIVLDENGSSKRFGFVSFGKEDDVKNVLAQGSIFFWGKKINVGPAVKKKFYDDVKGKPATLVFDKATLNTGSNSHVVYQPIESPQLQTADTTSSCLTMKLQQSPYTQFGNSHSKSTSEYASRTFQLPVCTTLSAVPGPVPSLIPRHPYQIAPQAMSDPLLACTYALPFNSNAIFGEYPGSVAVSQDCIFPLSTFSSDKNSPVHYTFEEMQVLAMAHNCRKG